MDVLDQILDSLRLTGGVVVDARAHGDWCMIAQFTREYCSLYFPVPGTLVGYHYIRAGNLVNDPRLTSGNVSIGEIQMPRLHLAVHA
jgi:hypothetical protein